MGFILGVLFLSVGFIFSSLNLLSAASTLQSVLAHSLGA